MPIKIIKESGYYHIRGTFMGERVRRTTGLRSTVALRPAAEKFRVAAEKEIIEGTFGQEAVHETFRDAAHEYLLWKRMESKIDKRTETKIANLVRYFGDDKLIDIDNGDVATFITTEWRHMKPGSVKRYLNDLIAILRYADSRIKSYHAPTIKRPYVDDERTVHLEMEEAVELLEWFKTERPHYYPHFTTLVSTGVRLGELLTLKPRSFSHNKQVTMVRKRASGSKTKTLMRDVPMTPDMVEIGLMMQHKPVGEPVFQSPKGPWKDANCASGQLNPELHRACKELGFPHEGEEAIRVHDLRHTFAYLTASAGADLGDLQYLMGHSDISMTMRYRGFIQSRARTYVSNMMGKSAGD
tara:strand:- start:3078 stop:4142 length:1065 start_codon:yes stop_codon:yes gene_type:complete